MQDGEKQVRFLRGRELFHAQCYFACHEEWEEVWRASEGATRKLLQGLIQSAVGCHHARRGNRLGAERVWARGVGNLKSASHALGCWRQIEGMVRLLEREISGEAGVGELGELHLDLDRIPETVGRARFSSAEEPS